MGRFIQAAHPTAAANSSAGDTARSASARELETALLAGRERTLAMFDGFEAALGVKGLHIAQDAAVNLPLWELGHIGWFEEWWTLRTPDRARGIGFDATLPRGPSLSAQADHFYDSAQVPHVSRWQLALPGPQATRHYLQQVREAMLALLRQCANVDESDKGDKALYFFRLVLLHEDMHREAWFMLAQQLGINLCAALPGAAVPCASTDQWQVSEGMRRIGAPVTGFAFDNECSAHETLVQAFDIDREPVTWERYLPFVQAGGYDDELLWTPEGWAWRQRCSSGLPLHLRLGSGGYEARRFGVWAALAPDAPAIHLSAHEAVAWCRFASRRLPTELEWETAARLAAHTGEVFEYGQVWEWTASPFAPYAGFVAHPYQDYSEPFFDGRPVLRGGSLATEPRMVHPAYRNYFEAHRRDVFAGFRSCGLH